MRSNELNRAVIGAIVVFLIAVAFVPAATADHDTYEQDVVTSDFYLLEDANVDVIIVPPAHGQLVNDNGVLNGQDTDELHPYRTSYLQAIEDSVDAWRDGIDAYGADWLQDLTIDDYVLGRDDVPADVLADPDVVITNDEDKTVILGMAFRGLMIPDSACTVHNSMAYLQSFTYADMYNINGHEFGHCLGLSHVVDGEPAHDLMDGTYDDDPGAAGNHLHCVSNLNIAGLEAAAGHLFGQGNSGEASVPISDYETLDCEA